MSLPQRLFGSTDEPEPESEPEPTAPDPTAIRMPLDHDDMLALAKNDRRRAVLRTLNDTDGGVIDLGTLAEMVAADECDKPIDLLSHRERKRVYVGLYQCHLPKLDKHCLVTVDERTSQVATTALTEHAVAYLDVLDEMHGSGGDG